MKPITDLGEVERWAGEHLENSTTAALRDCSGWTYRPIRWGLRRPTGVTVPHPDRLTTPDEATRWAAVARDLAVESRELTIPAVVTIGVAFSLITTSLGFGLSTMDGSIAYPLVLIAEAALVLLALGLIANVVRPMHDAPLWEKRAEALRARADELVASNLATREVSTPRTALWPWQRAGRRQAPGG